MNFRSQSESPTGSVDVEAQVARMKIIVERGDQSLESGLC